MTPPRWRVYVALRDGACHTGAATLLDMTRPTVEHHARALVRDGVLRRRDDGPGKPARYVRGGKAALYEAKNLDRPGRTGPGEDVRNHRGEYSVKVRAYGAHKAAPPVDKTWAASGVEFSEWWHTCENGERVRVRESKGQHNTTLTLQPEERMTQGAAERDALDLAWARLVDRAMDELSALYGYDKAGAIRRVSPIESAVPAPALERGVRVRGPRGSVWTDGSKGTEAETDTRSIAVAMAALPDHLDEYHRERADIMAALEHVVQNADRIRAAPIMDWPDWLEPVVRTLEAHGDALSRLLGVPA